MARLTEEDKEGLLADARSKARREDFQRLRRKASCGFSLEWLDEIVRFIPMTYPRRFIKADKNRL